MRRPSRNPDTFFSPAQFFPGISTSSWPATRNLAERIAGHLKARATQELVARGAHPFVQFRGKDGRFPSVWTHRPWKVCLNSYSDIERSVKYVEDNPLKQRKPRQHWSFVTEWKRPQAAPTLVDPRLADPLAGSIPATRVMRGAGQTASRKRDP